jgi:hypothetical protein
MPIELFGVISISEIAAIVALIISTITTVFLISNYIQTKKSVIQTRNGHH